MSQAALKRLRLEAQRQRTQPTDGIVACPDPGNALLWHYAIDGPKDTPYEGGQYFGRLKFPAEYPFAPPSILMTTPSGRFHVDTRLCLSISDFHPKEWNPMWNVSTILTGLVSFMVEKTQTYGSLESTDDVKRDFAAKSHAFNKRLSAYRVLFPDGFVADDAGDSAGGTEHQSVNANQHQAPTFPVTLWVLAFVAGVLGLVALMIEW